MEHFFSVASHEGTKLISPSSLKLRNFCPIPRHFGSKHGASSKPARPFRVPVALRPGWQCPCQIRDTRRLSDKFDRGLQGPIEGEVPWVLATPSWPSAASAIIWGLHPGQAEAIQLSHSSRQAKASQSPADPVLCSNIGLRKHCHHVC